VLLQTWVLVFELVMGKIRQFRGFPCPDFQEQIVKGVVLKLN
jgi:hypothetical protein